MINVSVDDFQHEVDCDYDGERYSVRDNGAVSRQPQSGKSLRPNDNKWVFGKLNSQNGYLYISQKRIHRIVATAFHGQPLAPEYVVDHIDTNRQNNRPENLRWITRLENALNNPITRKRIEYLCGSIEEFLENPSILNDIQSDPDLAWMRTVTPEEAKNCLVRMSVWANSYNKATISTVDVNRTSSLGEWIYKPLQKRELEEFHAITEPSWAEPVGRPKDRIGGDRNYGELDQSPSHYETFLDKPSLTPAALQRRWKTPTEFPSCPRDLGPNALAEYAGTLEPGTLFSRNRYGECLVVLAKQEGALLSVLVESMEERPIKPWAVAKVTIESGKFIHESVGSFFQLNGAKRAYYQLLGISFEGESIDDYC